MRRHRRIPVDLPAFALSRRSVRLFNDMYYAFHRPQTSTVEIDEYFYPLDGIHDWNRLYGRRGFVQYQCVLPLAESRAGLRSLLTEIARDGQASFLAVLKRLGQRSFGYLSFPREGYTLALDFPATSETFALLDRLDEIVVEHGGRLYLAKDARTKARSVAAGYPDLDRFLRIRRSRGLDRWFQSLQSRRLEL